MVDCMAGRKKIDIEARLYEKIDKRGPSECWPWKGYTHKGYAMFSIGNVKHHALRVAWELANGGLIPAGMEMDHVCGDRLCCNPAHGEVVTHSENMKRAWARSGGRMRTHFRDTAVFAAFMADPRPWQEKASDHGVAKSTAYTWAKQGVQKRYHRPTTCA
jgi:hypothetical protein